MATRTRTFSKTGIGGTVVNAQNGDVLGTANVVYEEKLCEDEWKKKARADGSLPPSNCLITDHFRDPYMMHRSTGVSFWFYNHPVTNVGTTSVAGFDSVRPARGTTARTNENRTLALELLATTNPYRSEYSVLVSIKELLDLGALFKLSAKTFSGFAGGAYLNYKFGWQQFVRDLSTLHGITTVIERRIKEFQSLAKKGGLRRNGVHLRAKSAEYYNAESVLQSAWNVNIRAEVTGTYQCQTLGSVRWRLKPGYDKSLHKLRAFNHAVKQVLDLRELNPQTVWNLIPFSWLVDYFVDISSYFGAGLASGIVEPYDICIIRRCKSRFRQKITTKPASITLTGSGYYGRNLMERDVVTLSSLTLPGISLLNESQMLTITALLASFKR